MPHRTMTLWLGIVGLLVLAVFIFLGRNLDEAASRGPRWKRRLMAAGLSLLGLLGYQPALLAGRAGRQGKVMHKGLAENQDWKQILEIYRDAEKIASGSWYGEPFDAAGKKNVLANLAKAAKIAQHLHSIGLLTKAEAALITTQLQDLSTRVSRFRVKRPGPRPTCYKVAPPRAAYKRSVATLKKQLPLLKRLRSQKVLHPEVLQLVKQRIERDLANAENATPGWPRPQPGEISRAKKLGRYARSLWNRLWKRVRRKRHR